MSNTSEASVDSHEGETELREFVYLDSLSVNSLLASLYMAVPEDVEKVFEEGEEGQKRKQAEAGLTLSNLLRLGGLGESVDAEHEMTQTTTGSRINDQYRFTVLYEALRKRGKIRDLTGDGSDSEAINPSEVVKIEGNCSPDPLYRIFGTAALLEEEPDDGFGSFLQRDEQSNRDKYEIYNGVVGLKLRPENGTGPFGLVVKEDELWIDSRREFLGPQKYTVLARVEGKIPNKSEWDLIDALRVLAGILPPEKLNEKREELLDDLFENSPVNSNAADQLVAENLLESLKRGEIGIHNIEQEEQKLQEAAEEYIEEQDEGAELDVTDFMDRDDFTLSDGYIVDPIAIYW